MLVYCRTWCCFTRPIRAMPLRLAVLAVASCAPQIGPPPSAAPRAASAETAPAKTVEQTATDRDRYVVQAMAPPSAPELRGRRLYGTGTGFYVAPDRVVTNSHVAHACDVRTVGNGTEGNQVIATMVADDPADDLALLAVDAPAEPASFETELYTETGRGLAVIGYPAHGLAVRLAELSPVTARQADMLAERPNYPFNGEVHPGNSGSPVLDGSGAVVGVVVKKIDTVAVYQHTGKIVDEIGVAISNRTVLDFLRANHVAVRRAPPALPLTPEALLSAAHGFVRQIGCWK
jgi:serine protease Do